MYCASCGRKRLRAHRFCPACGYQHPGGSEAGAQEAATSAHEPGVAYARTQPRRMHVSVLFVDVCDSTARIASAEPEEGRRYLDHALGLMTEAVQAYGGTVNQWLGDGLVALFGAPVAQEDHALRACLAAIRMQQRAADPQQTLALRIGVHSGEVLVGGQAELGAPRYRADGSTIHIASRLEKLAQPGAVLISASTAALLGDQLLCKPLGPTTLRGVPEPICLYELAPDHRQVAVAPLMRRKVLAPMVGREASLAWLTSLSQQVLDGRMRVVGLRGEAGIGKSRLLLEFGDLAQARGFARVQIGARVHAQPVPYRVIADLVRALLGLSADQSLAAQHQTLLLHWPVLASSDDMAADATAGLRDAACDLLGLAEASPAWLALSPNQRRRKLGELLLAAVHRRLHQGPLLLVVEDFFASDRDSRRLLEGLVRKLADLPVLICVSYRHELEHRWAESPWFAEHWLGSLPAPAMQTMAQALLGCDDSLPALLQDLLDKADGNPFFLEQLTAMLVDDATLVGTPGAYRCVTPPAAWKVPASVQAVVGARLGRLSADVRASLEAVAVLGDAASAELIAQMQTLEVNEADAHLALAVSGGMLLATTQPDQAFGVGPVVTGKVERNGLFIGGTDASSPLRASPEGLARAAHPISYGFRHALVQDVVLNSLTRPRRRDLHRAAFVALHKRARGSDDAASQMARHAYRGELWADTVDQVSKAMARMVARSANRDALQLFEQVGLDAIRHMPPGLDAQRRELRLRLDALGAMLPLGQIDDIVSNLQLAERLAEGLAQAGDDMRALATVSLQLALMAWWRGRYREGLTYAARAQLSALATSSRTLQMGAAQARMMLQHGLGAYGEALREAATAEDVYASELRARRLMPGWAVIASINVLVYRASALTGLGRYVDAQFTCERAYRELNDQDHAYSRVLVDFAQGALWLAQRQPVRAVPLLRAALQSCKSNDVPTMLPAIVALLGGALARMGRCDDALNLLEDALRDRIWMLGGRYTEYYLRHQYGVALALGNRFDEAMVSLDLARSMAEGNSERGHEAETLFELGETCALQGRLRDAVTWYDLARQAAEDCQMEGLLALIDVRRHETRYASALSRGVDLRTLRPDASRGGTGPSRENKDA